MYWPVNVFINITRFGLALSCRQALKTITENEQEAVPPAPSVAVQVTVVEPTGKIAPDGGLQVTVAAQPFASVADGVVKLTASVERGGHAGGATAITADVGHEAPNEGAGLVTVVVAVAELFAVEDSVVEVETVAVLLMTVALGTAQLTFTTSVNTALAPAARLGLVAVTMPVPPTGGVITVQSAGAVNDTKVVLVGMVSESETLAAAAPPELVTVIV
jgi:hypothetical protein